MASRTRAQSAAEPSSTRTTCSPQLRTASTTRPTVWPCSKTGMTAQVSTIDRPRFNAPDRMPAQLRDVFEAQHRSSAFRHELELQQVARLDDAPELDRSHRAHDRRRSKVLGTELERPAELGRSRNDGDCGEMAAQAKQVRLDGELDCHDPAFPAPSADDPW